MQLNGEWFSEVYSPTGSAFSLKTVRKLHDEQTAYQRIEIYATEGFGNLMVIDGCTMLSTRDNFLYHEMMSHPVLYTHAAPRKVVIVGGGDCGTLREVLAHDEVQEVWQVEIDERVTRLAEQYFPELCDRNNDPRAQLYFGDGIQWIKDAAPGSLDVIIVDSTDPVGPAEGLFGEAFYRDCLKALGQDGLLIQQSESPLFHLQLLQDVHAAMRRAGYADVKTLQFPQCIYPSGWWSATMACKSVAIQGFREQAVNQRRFATQYYNADIHRAAFAMPEFFRRQIKS